MVFLGIAIGQCILDAWILCSYSDPDVITKTGGQVQDGSRQPCPDVLGARTGRRLI